MLAIVIICLLAYLVQSNANSIDRLLAASVDDDAAAIPLISNFTLDSKLTVYYDPPFDHFEPTALAVFVRAYYEGVENIDTPFARVYYQTGTADLNLNSSYATYDSPYIELTTAFKGSRNQTISLCAVMDVAGSTIRSEIIRVNYTVEGGARPNSYGFFIPGIESGGYFIGVELETAAAARAQAAGSQEFADFTTNLGIGTYPTQVQALKLTDFDPELTGFEGGFAVNMSMDRYYDGNQHYGILIPYHNGVDFYGKVVRVNLFGMKNTTKCSYSYRMEQKVNGTIVVTGRSLEGGFPFEQDACVYVLDVGSLHPKAKGFKRGFVNYPYGYLSAGEFSVIARIDVSNFHLSAVSVIDLSIVNPTYGGYSGGFADGSWSCFNPFKTFAGPIGGIRSTITVDGNHLRPYYYSTLLCVNETAWEHPNITSVVAANIQTLDFSSFEEDLRGFSDVVRVGRYAYFTPLSTATHTYSYKIVRVNLGVVDIGTTLKQLYASGGSVRSIMDILDLSKISPYLAGYSGIFSSGKHLILVPYHNAYEPSNGQRGHGYLTRLNMNDFSLKGIDYLDLTVASRNQIPSFAEVNLRGFSYGFASGSYGLLVPFFNAVFNGKIARFYTQAVTLDTNIQELDLVVDRTRPNIYKGYRGGFVSMWQGSDPKLG